MKVFPYTSEKGRRHFITKAVKENPCEVKKTKPVKTKNGKGYIKERRLEEMQRELKMLEGWLDALRRHGMFLVEREKATKFTEFLNRLRVPFVTVDKADGIQFRTL